MHLTKYLKTMNLNANFKCYDIHVCRGIENVSKLWFEI